MNVRHAPVLTGLAGLVLGVGLTVFIGGPRPAEAKRRPPAPPAKTRLVLELTRDASNQQCFGPTSARSDCCPKGFSLAGVSVRGTGTPVVVCLEN